MTVTTMFLMSDKPAYEGVYKLNRLDGSPNVYSRYFAGVWRTPCATVDEAAVKLAWAYPEDEPSKFIGWRGLADRPVTSDWCYYRYVITPGWRDLLHRAEVA